MEDEIKCIVCSSVRAHLEWSLSTNKIVERLSTEWGLRELEGESLIKLIEVGEIRHFLCLDCEVGFWYPVIAGDNEFYKSISNTYVWRRWDKDVVNSRIREFQLVADLGSGPVPIFMRRSGSHNVNCVAVDENPVVREASVDSNFLHFSHLSELVQNGQVFDHVTALHFLEHLSNPVSYFSDIKKILKPSGKVWVSVPNRDRDFRHLPFESFDVPPHHVTSWNLKALSKFMAIVGFKIDRIWVSKPLAKDSLAYRIKWKFGFRREFIRVPIRKMNANKQLGYQFLISCSRLEES